MRRAVPIAHMDVDVAAAVAEAGAAAAGAKGGLKGGGAYIGGGKGANGGSKSGGAAAVAKGDLKGAKGGGKSGKVPAAMAALASEALIASQKKEAAKLKRQEAYARKKNAMAESAAASEETWEAGASEETWDPEEEELWRAEAEAEADTKYWVDQAAPWGTEAEAEANTKCWLDQAARQEELLKTAKHGDVGFVTPARRRGDSMLTSPGSRDSMTLPHDAATYVAQLIVVYPVCWFKNCAWSRCKGLIHFIDGFDLYRLYDLKHLIGTIRQISMFDQHLFESNTRL
jgi:hypothetical protein